MYIYHIFIIYSFVGKHLGYFHYDYETISMNVQIPLIRLRVLCIGIFRSVVVESYGSLRFFFFRTFNINFYASCVSLHSQQHWIKYLFFFLPCILSMFMLSLLTWVRWLLKTVLIHQRLLWGRKVVDNTYSPITRISRNNLETVKRIQLPKWVVLGGNEILVVKREKGELIPKSWMLSFEW